MNFWRKEQCVGVVEFCSILDHFFCFTLQSCFCPSPSVCVCEENSAETSSRFTPRCGVCLCVWFSALLKYWITFCRRRLDGTTTSSSRSSSSIAAAHSSACWSSSAAAYCFSSLAFDFVTFEGGRLVWVGKLHLPPEQQQQQLQSNLAVISFCNYILEVGKIEYLKQSVKSSRDFS